MKKMEMRMLLCFLVLLIPFSIFSQNISRIASYKSFVKTEVQWDSLNMSPEIREQVEKIVRNQSQKEYELLFNRNEALFREKERLDTPEISGGTVTIMRTGGVGIRYVNQERRHFINQTEILGKEFLISDTLINPQWKLGNETKNIGEYSCFKATMIRPGKNPEDDVLITAWYAPQIPVPFGPEDYGGLPGLILELQDNKITYLCNRIILNPEKPVSIKSPSHGTKVSQQEFDAIREKKTQEFEEMYPTKNNVRVEVKRIN